MSQIMTNVEGVVRVQTRQCPSAGDRLAIDNSPSWRFSDSGECPSMKHRDPVSGQPFFCSSSLFIFPSLSWKNVGYCAILGGGGGKGKVCCNPSPSSA